MITNPNPIPVPAVPAQVADALWVRSLNVSAPSITGKVAVSAQIVPYISSTGTLLPAQAKVLSIPDVFAAAATDTNVGTALNAIFAAVQTQVVAKNLFPAQAPHA
jgi:hypothetical protein